MESLKVLIVEDEATNVMLLELLFRQIGGIERVIVQNGREAVDICRSQSFNTILMDIRMPVMDGFEATKIIKEFNKDIPIVALTTFSFDLIDKSYKEAGFDYYMQKPVSIDQLKKYFQLLRN